ncbi:NAD-dependent succinate-semialdehyde dehydrogenase [Cnuibacter physcomitrellae]|uniref:Succinate-semialdehyde dehydrogenase (NADP(+)) n=1 Tax=Cnuibacter physcomitrellae TaxID=1619308 RepID=A0A1X9LTE5_9MICO|nr:NAD-dependent succinate-semialdehyde dehydrogenase [Cnuibacter physcomitrellae]ARJ07682.1 succinate-semialdehyde dehydrogenase (NADP(+)) [Cnuibacter physcomitrellae]GGI42608.1 NAD-dependent succinate-semialdehyde dehydrogenase [Cnuibacter physcomitrellae]
MTDYLDRLFIDGEWQQSSSGETFPVVNPADGSELIRIADGDAEDMTRAIDGAEAAQADWAARPALERSQILRRAAEIARADIDRLAAVMTAEHGKPLAQSVGELDYGLGFIEWFAEEARRAYGTTIPSTSRDKRILAIPQAAGVSVAITPWNFPSLQILRKLGAALAAGCSMVVKPAALTPLSALEIGRFFSEAGLPAGVLQIVPSSRASRVSPTIMADGRVRVLSFTGSTEVGKILMREGATTMKRLSLELGGHAPFIVFDDADVDLALDQLIAVKMRNMGQTCVSANRVFVQRSIAPDFTRRLVERLSAMRIGFGSEEGVEVGPLIEASAVEKVESHVADAVASGATVLTGGKRPEAEELGRGHFYEPTVLAGATDDMLIARDETFGPVAPIFEFDTEEEVVRRANNSPYGLAAYFFTRDVNRVVRVSEALEYGTVGANDGTISAVQAPFGGVKESGIGREGGHWGVEEYMDVKYISLAGLSRP